MRLRRAYICFFIVAFCAASSFAGVSYAADETVSVAASVAPGSLPGNGQVQVTANVTVSINRASGISGAHIEGPGVVPGSANSADIQPGNADQLTCVLNVAAAQLGLPIQLFVKWEGEAAGNAFIVTVAQENPVTFTRTISPDKASAYKGDAITVTYTVTNEGASDITNVSVADEGMPGMPQSAVSVAAGQSKEFKSTFDMSADFTSAPTLTYTLGGSARTAACPAKSMTMKVVQLDATLSAMPASTAPGGGVLLVCGLANSGNVQLSDLEISDGRGVRYYSFALLDKGGTQTYSRKVVLTQTAKFELTVTAKDDTGKTWSFKTNELEVKVSSDGSEYNLDIDANPDALQIAGPGEVGFEIVISNNGPGPVFDAYVTDQNGNTIESFASLPPGNTRFPYKSTIGDTTQFVFSLIVPRQGGDYRAETVPLEIRVAPTASPAESPSAQPSDASGEAAAPGPAGEMGWLVTILIVIGALIVITIVVMVALAVAEKRNKQFSR